MVDASVESNTSAKELNCLRPLLMGRDRFPYRAIKDSAVWVQVPLVTRPVMELVYVLDLKSKLCGFESRRGDDKKPRK